MARLHGRAVIALVVLLVVLLTATTLVEVKGVSTEDPSAVLRLINQDRLWETGVSLENISWRFPAARIVGTAGNRYAREWILEQLRNLGLEVWQEPDTMPMAIRKYLWNVTTTPYIALDPDNDPDTTEDRIPLESHRVFYGSPSTPGPVFSSLLALPLPRSCQPYRNLTLDDGDRDSLMALNTSARVVFSPLELWKDPRTGCAMFLNDKLNNELPSAAIVAPFNEETPPGYFGYSVDFPVYSITYEEGRRIQELMETSNISVVFSLNTSMGGADKVYNVMARLPSARPSGKTILIGAHYDTVNTPGFVDNSLGVAAILELARVFAQAARDQIYTSPHDLKFVCFDGEEFGRLGSLAYAKRHREDLEDVLAVLVFDCIGTRYPKIQLSTRTGGDLLPNAQFPLLLSEGGDLLAHGIDVDQMVMNSARTFDLEIIGVDQSETWGSDHNTFSNRVPTLCYNSGTTTSETPKLTLDLPLVHTPFMDSYRSPNWATSDAAFDQVALAALTVVSIGQIMEEGQTPGQVLKGISDVVEGVQDSEVRRILEEATTVIEESFSQSNHTQAMKRAEVIYALSQLEIDKTKMESGPGSEIMSEVINVGLQQLQDDPSQWYFQAVHFQSPTAYVTASMISGVSDLLQEARDKIEEREAQTIDRLLTISLLAFHEARFEKAIQYAESAQDGLSKYISETVAPVFLHSLLLLAASIMSLHRGTRR